MNVEDNEYEVKIRPTIIEHGLNLEDLKCI